MHEVCCFFFVGLDNYSNNHFSVSEDLLCAFELLKPLDGPALRKEMTKAKRKRCVSLPSPRRLIKYNIFIAS